MKLKKLIAPLAIEEVHGSREIEITGICADSRLVVPGNLFVARRGNHDDGTRYIPDALAAGAAAIATDLADPSLKGVTQVVTPELRATEAALAAEFYGHPSRHLFTVGITGTNGKTTTSYLIKYLLDALGVPCGLMGTIEAIIGQQRQATSLTTPAPSTTQKALADMVRHGCEAAVLEVSSHGLDQQRVAHIDFDIGIFTNLSHDHLDYHKDLDTYAATKAKLFRQCRTAILNADDPYVEVMREAEPDEVVTYGTSSRADLQATNMVFTPEGTHFDMNGVPCYVPLVGRFNVYNALAALAVAKMKGLELRPLIEALSVAPCVRGRLEPVPNSHHVPVYVDYAHTPDALRQVLTTLRELEVGRLILVFGCGGNRDREKRPIMGEVATLADVVIVTSDNPRSEDPLAICNEISAGRHTVIVDRTEAITEALSQATTDDIVVIAGKGHEAYQVFAHRHIPFDDRDVVQEACKKTRP